MNIFFTSVSLALELVAAPALGGTYALYQVQCLRTGGTLISSLYIFELIYRLKMRMPLIVHHFLTIFAISFTVSVWEYTESMTYMVSAVVWLFQATTEQPTFVGLLGYRLDWSPKFVARLLQFAALQTFIVKSASAVGLLVYWKLNQDYDHRPIDVAWTCMVWIIAIGLLLTQIWGSYVTYAIGRRILQIGHLPSPTDVPPSSLTMYSALHLARSRSRGKSVSVLDFAGASTRRSEQDSSTNTSDTVVPPVPELPLAYRGADRLDSHNANTNTNTNTNTGTDKVIMPVPPASAATPSAPAPGSAPGLSPGLPPSGGSEKEKLSGEVIQAEDEPTIPNSTSIGDTTTVPEIGSPVSEAMHTAPTSPDVDADVTMGKQAELLERAALGVEAGNEALAEEATGTAL
ncbi:hypothetical protein JCM24511_01262 [Saitozyma sp. JCM 24511]|nr:hypothetical protein JCM24511_01262 [Saitozyma sp. JCM 24511]